jgi:hypothetical protein
LALRGWIPLSGHFLRTFTQRAKRSQHTAVTRYRYFSCLGTVFLHRLFFGPIFWTRPCAGCIDKKTRTELHQLFFGPIFWTRLSGCINEKQELK